ncbi:MAG: hypothetical protein ABIE84_01795 [bacterium]
MTEGKRRMEILLEEIRSDVKLTLEGHDVLRSELKQAITESQSVLRSEMRQMGQSLKNEIKVTGMAIIEKLDEHIKQPAHA